MAEKPRITQLPGTIGIQEGVKTIALGTADELIVWRNNTGATLKVTEFGYTPDTAVTGNTTDNFTLRGKVKTAAGAAAANLTAVKTYGTGVNISQFVVDTLTLATTAASLLIDNGELVTLDKAETGSGLALPEGIVTIKGQFV